MLSFPYQSEPLAGQPPPSMPANATGRWRPLIPIRIIGPTGQSRLFSRALLDVGSDDTVFPAAIAGVIGAMLQVDSGHGVRWRGQPFSLRYADVELELADSGAVWQWPAVVGFSPAPIRYPILGNCGCLQFFDARFLGEDRIVEIETNPSFPGTKS